MKPLFNINLKNNISFTATSDVSILDSSLISGHTLEHSCKNGNCGVCKTKLLSGDTVKLQSETYLSDAEISAGYILTCCRGALSDISLSAEDLGNLLNLKNKISPCRISSIVNLTKDIINVTLRTPPSFTLEYSAGQYLDLIGVGGLRRSYSIANAPVKNELISLHIKKVNGGKFSDYWFNQAKENDLLYLDGPKGTFCLRRNYHKNLILVATGTGIAPIKAILEQLAVSDADKICNHIYLYWGARKLDDIYWSPHFANLPITFKTVLSRDFGRGDFSGYVQDAILSDQHRLEDSVVYSCGSQIMINSLRDKLMDYGLMEDNFYSDAFVQSG